jgi:anti-sigma factor RsiW
MKGTCVQHFSEEDLELYALGRASEELQEQVEEHLLICTACQEKVTTIDQFVAALRTAIAHPEAQSKGLWARFMEFLTPQTAAWAAAGAFAAILFVLAPAIIKLGPTHDVELALTRGAETAAAPSGTSLRLSADVRDLPASSAYTLEIVDAAGRLVWERSVAAQQGTLSVSSGRGLAPGVYWVRLYADPDKRSLLREFSLVVK